MNLVSVDPGIRAMGAAWFSDGKLIACKLIRNPAGDGSLADHMLVVESFALWVRAVAHTRFNGFTGAQPRLAIEIPRVYPAARQKGDQNDLINLAVVAGGVAGHFAPGLVTRYYPRDWKGSVNPEESNRRVVERLGASELETMARTECPKSLQHNLIDAIGVGLFHLGRFDPRKVYPF